jgi:hypothetical protein
VKDLKPITSTSTVADTLIGIIIVAAIGYTVGSVINSAVKKTVLKKRFWRSIDKIVFGIISVITLYFLVQYPFDIAWWLILVILLGLGYGELLMPKKDVEKAADIH